MYSPADLLPISSIVNSARVARKSLGANSAELPTVMREGIHPFFAINLDTRSVADSKPEIDSFLVSTFDLKGAIGPRGSLIAIRFGILLVFEYEATNSVRAQKAWAGDMKSSLNLK